MKRLLVFVFCLFGVVAQAQDALSVTYSGGQFSVIEYEWTSDGSGDATGRTSENVPGVLYSIATVPSATDAPTDDYDIVVKQVFDDLSGNDVVLASDVISGAAADRDTADTEIVEFWPTDLFQTHGKIQIEVSNAGSAKAGKIRLFIYRTLVIQYPPGGSNGIPLGGAAARILQYTSPATAKWVAMSGDATIADGGAVTVNTLGALDLTDPNADRIGFWDDSEGLFAWLTVGNNLSISGTQLNASLAGGGLTAEDIDTEAELETLLTDVTDVYTNNDTDVLLESDVDGLTLTIGAGTIKFKINNPSGNIGLAANGTAMVESGMVAEGSMVDDLEQWLIFDDPTSTDKTHTLPDRSGTLLQSGDTLTGDVTATFDTDGSTSTTIATDSVALTTDTTGNYVASITNGTGITGGNGGSEGAALTLALSFLGLQTLTDPGADRFLYWDDSESTFAWGTVSTGLDLTTTNLTSTLGTAIDSAEITNGAIVDEDINASAAIARSKLAVKTPIWLSAGSATPTTTTGAAAPALDADDNWAMSFGKGEFAFWQIPLPSDFDGSVENIVFYWYMDSAMEDVTWSLAVVVFSDASNTTMDAAYGSENSASADGSGETVNSIQETSLSASSLLGASSNAGFFCKVRVKATTTAGSFTNEPQLVGVKLEY